VTEPTFDADGYPSEETLQAIATLDPAAALDLARAAWHWPDFASELLREAEAGIVADPEAAQNRYVRFATGGWSGNELVVAALNRNVGVRLYWRLSACGGLHIYRYPGTP